MIQPKRVQTSTVPQSQRGRRGSTWTTWITDLGGSGEALCFEPADRHEAHVMRSTAYSTATRLGMTISTRLVGDDGGALKLYIWAV